MRSVPQSRRDRRRAGLADARGGAVPGTIGAMGDGATADPSGDVQAILNACPHVQLIVDRQGKIAFVNHCVVNVLGYQPDELVGMPVHVLVPDPVRDLHQTHVDAYFRNPVARALGSGRDLVARRRDTTVFPAEISLSPLDTDD